MGSEDNKRDEAIAVMANDMTYIKASLQKIDQRLEIMDSHYIKREEVMQLRSEADKVHAGHEARIKSMEIESALQKEINSVFRAQVKTWGSAAVIASGIIQFLIGKFF